MNIETLRFKPISHLPQGQLVQYLSSINSNNTPNRLSAPQSQYPLERQKQENKRYSLANIPTTNHGTPSKERPTRDSFIQNFVKNDNNSSNSEVIKLKQQCTRLRFQKIALQNNMQKLRQQITKKDQIIRGLTSQMGNNNVVTNIQPIPTIPYNIQGLRNTIGGIY